MKTVLIIDDEKDIRDVLVVALSAEGWLVQSTESLLGALNILSQDNNIHCMLLDYNLPGMPMEEFLKQVSEVSPKTGIVLLSAVDRVAEKAQKLGIKNYLGKPFDFDTLRKVMNSCLCSPEKT